MKIILFVLFSWITLPVFAQKQTRGIVLDSSEVTPKKSGKTYALIFGISKYKNTSIPQLQYADADAKAFYRYLISTGADSNYLILRTNETATYGEFWANIDYLTNVAEQGDKIFIYFSGHGDVENKTIVKDAYLLPYDAPRSVYPISAINVLLLKSWIATWSSKGVQAVFIADACRSGNLAGGREGMEAAANMMKDKWQDEIKILSCQPGELSLEGKQWGGGRGLFSYHLINGLEGLADKDHDGKVTMRELSLYMMQTVPEDAAPMSQDPILLGNLSAVISEVKTKKSEAKNTQSSSSISMVEAKGFMDDLLKDLPDSVKYWYSQYNVSFDSGYYSTCTLNDDLSKAHTIRYSCFDALKKIDRYAEAKMLTGILKRNLSARMIDELNGSIDVIINNAAVSNYPAYANVKCNYEYELNQILGYERLKKMNLIPKFIYCKVVDKVMDSSLTNYHTLFPVIDSGIRLDPAASYLRVLYSSLLLDTSENEILLAKHHILKAIESSPKFILPYRHLSQIYRFLGMPDSSISVTKMMLSIDSSFAFCCYRHYAKAYYWKDNPDSMKYYFNKYYSLKDYTKDSLKLLDSYQMLYDEAVIRKDYKRALNLVGAEISCLEKMNKKHCKIKMEENRVAKDNESTGHQISAHFIYEVGIDLKTLYFERAKCYCKLKDSHNAIQSLIRYVETEPNPKVDHDKIINSGIFNDYLASPFFTDFLKKYFSVYIE